MGRKGNLKKAQKDITKWKDAELKNSHSSKSDFAALFYGVERGIFVYGKIGAVTFFDD